MHCPTCLYLHPLSLQAVCLINLFQSQLAGPSPTQTSSCEARTVHHPDLQAHTLTYLDPLSLQAVSSNGCHSGYAEF